ncbi:hypothetical protein XELAEV_18030769mg [Xenopus laevis]|uniref:Uncharacterized protein n=1 Tax=Xenopus laevis TaxID=8355 RepID=A0A974HFF9_XENLA|nr:hypothetical protein XELAEV_18030769mg [Xenopus laevis]
MNTRKEMMWLLDRIYSISLLHLHLRPFSKLAAVSAVPEEEGFSWWKSQRKPSILSWHLNDSEKKPVTIFRRNNPARLNMPTMHDLLLTSKIFIMFTCFYFPIPHM